MTIRTALKASSSRFAAAFGFPDAAAEDPKDNKEAAKPQRMDGESDEDYSKRCEEEEKKNKAKDGKEEETEASESEDEEKKKDEAKKAAGRAEGVKAERERWTVVLSAPEAKNKGLVAASLLADTDMEARALITVLAATPEVKTGGLYARMAAVAEIPAPSPAAAEGDKPGTAQATAKAIANAAAKARGEKPAAA